MLDRYQKRQPTCVLSEVDAEMLKALYELRYLTFEQLRSGWHPGRSVSGFRARLSRMVKKGFLERTVVTVVPYVSAWRLAHRGLEALRELVGTSLPASERLSPLYLLHLIETNDVFLALRGSEWVWERAGFDWRGSHKAGLPYVRAYNDGGLTRRRARVIRPDAIIAPHGELARPRVFLELDRSTESIRTRSRRRSIERKLRAYRAYIRVPKPGGAGTYYAERFGDDRPARVVFVLTKLDRGARDPAKRDRRLRAVLEVARTVDAGLDVRCVNASDLTGLRGACGMGGGPAPALPEPRPDSRLAAPTRGAGGPFHDAADILKQLNGKPAA